MSTGTGFIINKVGHVVTNFHVVKDASEVVVAHGKDTKVHLRPATIVLNAAEKDLVILKCDELPGTRSMTIVNRETKGGQEVMAIGFPGILDKMLSLAGGGPMETGRPGELTISEEDSAAFDPVAFPGNVGKQMPIESGFGGRFVAVAHSAKISEGNSGGPLIDRDGRLVGVNVQMAGTRLGADYAFSIHASELVALASSHGIPIDVTTSKVSRGGGTRLHVLLYIAVAAFAVVLFLLVLRKPRMVMVDAMSRVIPSRRSAPRRTPQGFERGGHSRQALPSADRGTMRLRGRDVQGRSFDLAFSKSDFDRAGGRLVIGRNGDLSQLVVPQDSVSRQHATLVHSNGTVMVADRNSGNGTRVNGCELGVGQPPAALR
ncbi:MAG: trypsin-like peptidase domain-containing protein, partial [Verrucomicrobiae bacterium]|nr:trypsin-like peptidase domain-containing protein [Verrucomicrobiae bacterium]